MRYNSGVYKNVIVGVDGRENGRDAIRLAQQLVEASGKLTLVNVRHPFIPAPLMTNIGDWADEHDSAIAMLEAEQEATGAEAQLLAHVAPTPGQGLHEIAEGRDADLVVVGSCSRGVFGRAVLGNDTRAALNTAPCAVAIAATGLARQEVSLETIGVAYNGSNESELALAKSRDLAAGVGAKLRALEVVTLPSYAFSGAVSGEGVQGTIESMLKEADERVRNLDGVDGRAIYGFSGEELANFSKELQLLVVGSRSYGPVKRLILGSTSTYLERHSQCSVLVLPRP